MQTANNGKTIAASKAQNSVPLGTSDINVNPFVSYKRYSAAAAAKLNALKFSSYIRASDTVLESGAKGGHLLTELVAARKVAIEANLQAHAVCKANGIEVYASLENAPAGKFSRIISHHFLEHVPSPLEELRRLRNRLSDDGKLIINVPIDDWRNERDWRADIDHHLHTWTPPLLANLLKDAGYEVETVEIMTHAWPKYWETLVKVLPSPLFHGLCRCWAVFRKSRQLLAVAHLPVKSAR